LVVARRENAQLVFFVFGIDWLQETKSGVNTGTQVRRKFWMSFDPKVLNRPSSGLEARVHLPICADLNKYLARLKFLTASLIKFINEAGNCSLMRHSFS
jgi:hypothetical protein